jgi:signal transduction histidine kinase
MTPRASLADRDYFERYVTNPAVQTGMSAPLLSRSPGLGWFFAVTRRVRNDERFDGVAVAAVVPRYFETLYQRMGLSAGEAIELYHADGALVARSPRDDARLGQARAADPLFADHVTRGETSGRFRQVRADGREETVTFRRLSAYPLVVVLRRDAGVLLASWRTTALAVALGLAALLALITALIAQHVRQRRVQERIRERRVQSDKLEALGRLTGGIVHDFNNVLGIVRSSIAVLAELTPDTPRARQAVAVAERGVRNGTALTGQLLAFARRQPLEVAPVDLHATLHEMLPLLRQAAGHDVDVTLHVPSGLACDTDAAQLLAALVNLCVNARDAMPEGGRIVIDAAPCSRDECEAFGIAAGPPLVRIAVRDTGHGMAPVVLQRAFDPFYTTKGVQGTGLGLPQVYGFVRQTGGEVRVESAPGQGTVVHLFFPAVASGASAGDAQARAR